MYARSAERVVHSIRRKITHFPDAWTIAVSSPSSPAAAFRRRAPTDAGAHANPSVHLRLASPRRAASVSPRTAGRWHGLAGLVMIGPFPPPAEVTSLRPPNLSAMDNPSMTCASVDVDRECAVSRSPGKPRRKAHLRALVALLVAAATLAAWPAARQLCAGEAGEGYRRPLIEGDTLDGWIVTGCEVELQGGVLLLKEGNGFVRTENRYRDFVLELAYRPRKAQGYDAGIYIRAGAPGPERPWPRQYQINLRDGDELNLIGFPQARSQGLVQRGDWNRMKLTVVGQHARMEINGQRAWETDGLTARDGYLGIQVEVPQGGQFELKDLFVTELGYQPLFDGQSLAGWEGGGQPAERCWKVEEGLLLCTGEKGPWLKSQKTYDDFHLRLEYRLRPGGNSGVYVRVPPDGRHHGEGAGIEVQILDDAAERYKNLKPYQYCGSLYALVPAAQHVGRPPPRWNSLEINCRGTRYHVWHNGVLIVAADEQVCSDLAARLTSGYLGLQNHSEEVAFRHVRIGPPLELPVEPLTASP